MTSVSKSLFLLMICVLCFAKPVLADDSITIWGEGLTDCATWNNHQRTDAIRGWIFGFVAGVSGMKNTDLLKGMTFQSFEAEINKACSLRPSQTIFDAASQIAVKLTRN